MTEIKLSRPLKYSYPKGTPVTVVDKYVNTKTGEQTWFKAPKVEGVYYNRSKEFFSKAIELKNKLSRERGPVNPKDPEQGNAYTNENTVFDFFTESCSGLILLFGAVEALTNRLIEQASTLNYEEEKEVKKITFSKLIIRWKKMIGLSLEELSFLSIEKKLKYVLPCLYKIESPASKGFWEDFKMLKRLRNGIIHPTRSNAYGAHENRNSVYAELFEVDFEKLINNIEKLMKYLDDNTKSQK